MSETIQVALITFAAGLFGAIIGAFATLWSARKNSETECAKTLHTEKLTCYSEFLQAYPSYVTLLNSISPNTNIGPGPEERSEYVRLAAAYNNALLLSGRDTQAALNKLMGLLSAWAAAPGSIPQKSLSEALADVFVQMQSETNQFTDR